MIIVEDVHKRYQTDHGAGKWVLQGVSFTIPPRLNVGLIGRNGSGKSTLLRLIGGVDTPNRGRIERRCRVSWPMGFGGGLQGSLTGRQNAKFVCRIHGHEADIDDRIAYIQEFTELGEAFDEQVKTYSSGMRSRLQFGLSLAFDFDVYISDEVTATGDTAFRKKAAESFKKLADHASLIMVSHGEGTLKQFCTAGIWLNEGQAHWFDDIDDALRAYKDNQEERASVSVAGLPVQTKQQPMPVSPSSQEVKKSESPITPLAILKEGLGGNPVTVDHAEGRKIIKAAKQEGMKLVNEKQITKLGYQLKPAVTPVLKKYSSTPDEKYIDLYELHSQCEKTVNSK